MKRIKITKRNKEVTTKLLRKIIGLKTYKEVLNHNRTGNYHTRTKKYDIHYIGRNRYLIQLKVKANDYLFE